MENNVNNMEKEVGELVKMNNVKKVVGIGNL